MEGISGLTNWKEPQERITKFMHAELNAAITGIFDFDKNAKIIVADSHSTGKNIDIMALPENVELISGYPREFYMVTGFEQGFDAAMFIGYHAPAGTEKAQMDHSYSSSSIFEAKINGKIVGESEINAFVLAEAGIPVVLISGDDKLKEFSQDFFQGTEFVVVKNSIAWFSAQLIHPKLVHQNLQKTATKSLKNLTNVKLPKIVKPMKMEITFLNTVMTEFASVIPGSKRTSGRTVEFQSDSAREIYKFLLAAVSLAGNHRNL